MSDTSTFFNKTRTYLSEGSFVKITLSKAVGKDKTWQNTYIRLVEIKGEQQLSFTYRFETKDEVKNYPIEEGIQLMEGWMGSAFLNADLFSTTEDVSLQLNKKRKTRLLVKKPTHASVPNHQHNKQKKRWIEPSASPYLVSMGVCNSTGEVLKSGQKKFRQINKYIEIIDGVLRNHPLSDKMQIVDMGSGKGYLTFALYDYLTQVNLHPNIVGIELREHLVDYCNELATKSGFEHLAFLAQDIFDFPAEKIDMLIALHACDIATDIAIAKGIQAEAEIIIVAPCCHKQVRKDMQGTAAVQAILQHGILAERQAEILTDSIRSLVLEAKGYKTKVFEFISTEHTPKNVMIVATKGKAKPSALQQIAVLKEQFGIQKHYLEDLLKIYN